MMTVTVVPLSTPLTLTAAAREQIRSANPLYLLSAVHPCAAPVVQQGLQYIAMDDLYDTAEDFDALAAAVAQRLLSAGGDCTFAVTGAFDALLPILKREFEGKADLRVLPGVSLSQAAFPEQPGAVRFTFNALPERIPCDMPLTVEEVDSAFHAGEMKLALMEFYPDDWAVTLAFLSKEGSYRYKELKLCELDREKRFDAATVLYVPPVPFLKKERFGFEDVLHIVRHLRAPGGCPWDREQTHASIRQDLLEECYEVLDAIDREDEDALTEELGDVLLQVVFHSVIAEEQSVFTHRDVETELVRKLIYRHPHVFGTVQVSSSDEVLQNWAKLKKKEKKQETQTEVLRSVPKCFPALLRSRKVQKRAADVGFDWSSAEEAFYKIAEETRELKCAMEQGTNVEEEMGDLLFAVVNVARLLKLEPENLLAAATDKFINRFERMEKLMTAENVAFEGLSLAEMDVFWNRAKAAEKR